MKVTCVEDPNKDYTNWIFESTGLEISKLPIYLGKEYVVVGEGLEGRCWGKTQSYYYLSELAEVGKVPTKYFRHTCEVRKWVIDNILENDNDL